MHAYWNSFVASVARTGLGLIIAAVLCGRGIAVAEVTFTIEATPGVVGNNVTVPISLATTGESEAPATFILFVQYDEALLNFVDAVPGVAVPDDKDLTVEQFDGELGLAVAGLADTDIENGIVIEVTFAITGDGGGVTIPVALSVDSSAASIDAEPLDLILVDGQISLGCLNIGAPTNVEATDGEAFGVNVTWDAVLGALEYRVFRSESNDSSAASPVSGWQIGTEFFDNTARAPMLPSGGCVVGELVFTTYFYFIKARTTVGCDSDFSASDDGFRGEDTAVAAGFAGIALLVSIPVAIRSVRRIRRRGERIRG